MPLHVGHAPRADLDRLTVPGDSSGRERFFLLFLPFLAAVVLTFATTPDDVFIMLRYAANLLHGDGLAFNPGQHVQGFTSPLDLVVAMMAYLIPGGLALFKMKLASLCFGVLALREAALLLEGLALPRWALRTGFLTVSLCSVVAFASGNGLETSLEMWLLLAVVRRLVLNGSRGPMLAVGAYSFAAVLARPDAIAPITCMAVVGLFIETDRPLIKRSSWFGGALIALIVLTVGELIYFKSLLPNTYYAKDLPLAHSISQGLRYLDGVLQPVVFANRARLNSVPIDFVNVLQTLFFVSGCVSVTRRRSRCRYLLALIVGQVLFIMKAGGEGFVGSRFLAVTAVPFIVVEVVGAWYLSDLLRDHVDAHYQRVVSMALGSLLILSSVTPFVYANAPIWKMGGLSDRELINASTAYTVRGIWIDLPRWLRCLRPGSLVATTEIGYFGFERLDLRILDMRGLTNSDIARQTPPSMKTTGGVDGVDWYLPSSPVGRVILRQMPSIIVEYDSLPRGLVLDGRYRLARTKVVGPLTVGFYVPTSSSPICSSLPSN